VEPLYLFFTVPVPSGSRYYRGTAIHEYRGTTVRYLPTNSHFSEDFSAKKKQFIDPVNKLEVFNVDDISVQLVSDGATAQLKRDWCSCAAVSCISDSSLSFTLPT